MTTPYLLTDIERDEGLRLRAYQDPEGIWTIGVGHTGEDVVEGLTWTPAEATLALGKDVHVTQVQMDMALPWWRELDDVRQDVLVNMGFNLGVRGLCAFKDTLGACRRGDWAGAANAMLASAWAREVKARATRLALQMGTGVRA
jgi:lysozyme